MMAQRVFRDYDAAGIEAQYDNRGAVPGHQRYFDEWAERSVAYRGSADARLDLSYGPEERERLDLFLPAKAAGPLHVFIHGGYWRSLDKDFFSYLAGPLTAAGATVALVNYPLCPAATLPQIADSLRRAVAWLYRNAARHGADPSRIHISGHSAGGHLVALMLATSWAGFAADLPAAMIRSGVAISGIYELAPLLHVSVNNDLRLDKVDVAMLSPATLAPAADVPVSIFVGAAELDEFVRQSKDFAAAWTPRLSHIDYIALPGHDHFSIVDGMHRTDDPIVRRLLEHMDLSRSGA